MSNYSIVSVFFLKNVDTCFFCCCFLMPLKVWDHEDLLSLAATLSSIRPECETNLDLCKLDEQGQTLL